MKTYKSFLVECSRLKAFTKKKKKKKAIKEEALAFTYNDGGEDMTVVISGSKRELSKIKKNLPAGTKMVNNVPEDAMKISASEWEQLQS